MHINISYELDFTELMIHLKTKYGNELFNIDGIGGQLDINKFSKDFFSSKTTADVSVDSNSNVSKKDTIVYNKEITKPYFRLNAYYLLWRKLKQLYSHEDANKIIEMQLSGDIYINDFHMLHLPYCFNFSTYDIALEGLTMVNKIKSYPPKHLYAFKSQLEQFITIASNSISGASSTADIFIVMGYYVNKILETNSDAGFKFNSEEDCWRYVRETIISFIYTINQPMRATDSPFTNVSIFDDYFLDQLIPDYNFTDGKTTKKTIKKIQELFLDIMNDEQERTPITFPVTTACFSIDNDKNIKDEKFLEMIADKNMKYGFINLYSGKTSTLSSCCFDKLEKFITSYGIKSFNDFKNNDEIVVPTHRGKWKNAKVKSYGIQKLYNITFENNKKQIIDKLCTKDHRWKLDNGTDSCDLKENDILLKTPLIYDYEQYNNAQWKVISIRDTNIEKEVWCLEVEDDESFILDGGIITGNCRLRSDMNDLNNLYFNTLGGSSVKIGSLGVVTVNIPRLAYKYKHNKELFMNKLADMVEDVAKINNSKRSLIRNRIKKDIMPLYSLGFMDLNKQYSTFGVTGLNEAVVEFGMSILDQDGIDFILEILNVINTTNDKMQKKYKSPHNAEQVPAENSSIKACKKDAAVGYDPKVSFYSNQFIPLTTNADMLDRIKLQGIFDEHFSGGAICHINIEERIEDKEYIMDLIKTCTKKGVIYFALNYNLQCCENNHMSVGKNETCQICGADITDNYTRAVGFLTNTKNWAKERRENDYTKRQFYKI